MDIVASLVDRLDLTEAAAKALAGQVLGLIEDTVREAVSFGVAAKVRNAVPELPKWQASSPTLPPGVFRASDFLGTPSPEDDELLSVLARFRVPASRAQEVRALALEFLSSRLDAATVAIIVRSMPALTK